ncbi:MAG: RNA ligase family protein [Nanoarchaeota archaeon]
METSLFKFPSLTEEYDGTPRSGKELFIYEKLDGGNVSIRRDGNKIVPWSRGGPVGRAEKYFFPAFRRFVFDLLTPEIYYLPEHLIPFGEFLHPGSGHIPYRLEHLNKFFMIGIYNTATKSFLHPQQRQEVLEEFNLASRLPATPLLRQGRISGRVAARLVQKSFLYDGPSEGIVIHEYETQYPHGVRMTKLYHPEFKEYDSSKQGIEAYLTTRRLVKAGQGVLAAGEDITVDTVVEATIRDVSQEIGSPQKKEEIEQAVRGKSDFIREKVIPLF